MKEKFALVVKRRGGRERVIEPDQFWINRNTPVGEDAEIWERKPFNGRAEILWSQVLRKEPRP